MGKSGNWALIAALAGFLFGSDSAVISGAEQSVQRLWQMSDACMRCSSAAPRQTPAGWGMRGPWRGWQS